MNFDRFKSVLPKKAQIDSTDTEYLQHLNGLKEPKQNNVWAAVGTVAAAVAIVAAVTLWALIGRGLRGTDPTPALPATEDETVEITEQMQQDFEKMYGKYSLHSLPTFERDTLPSKEALLAFLDREQGNFLADSKLTADEFNEYVLDWFGKTPGYEVEKEYELGKIITVDYLPPRLLTFTRGYLPDGSRIITLTYGDEDLWVVTLSYVAISDFEPDYFVQNTVLNTIYLQKIDKDKMTASVYKVSGKLATQILDAKRYLKHSEIGCKCIPDYRVCESTLWYNFILEGENPHTTRYDNPTCKLTADEQNKFKELFEKCITEENFVETKAFEYTPSADKVIVTVSAHTGNYKQGTHTITGDDAKALITALETKSYTGLGGLQGMTAEIKVGERTYYLYIGDDFINIENSCGGLKLSRDDDIAKIVEKYIKNPEDSSAETIIETGHSTYDKVTLINATETCLAAINEHKVVDRANENPTTKTFELDGKTLELTFKEKRPAPAAGGYVYTYTDSDEIWYGFYENKYFIDISDMGSHKKKPTVITKDEAFEIADKYARVMLGDDYENYQITVSEDFNSELYRFDFEKNYGKDGFLSGEIFGAFIYKNGRINSCSVMNKYMFEGFDPSLVAGITKADVDAALVKAYQDEGMDMSLYTPKADSYFLTNYEGKWYIGVSSVLYIGEEKKGRADTHYFEIS